MSAATKRWSPDPNFVAEVRHVLPEPRAATPVSLVFSETGAAYSPIPSRVCSRCECRSFSGRCPLCMRSL